MGAFGRQNTAGAMRVSSSLSTNVIELATPFSLSLTALLKDLISMT